MALRRVISVLVPVTRSARPEASRSSTRPCTRNHTSSPEVEAALCHCFEALLPALRPEYSEILRRVDLEGSRPADFAREAGLTANNAMVRLHRARKALRADLQRSCRTCADHGCLDCSCGVRVSR